MALVPGAVPGNMSEGGEGQGLQLLIPRPLLHCVQNGRSKPTYLMRRNDRELFDVCCTVDDVHNDVADWRAKVVNNDPAAAAGGVPGESAGLVRCSLVVS